MKILQRDFNIKEILNEVIYSSNNKDILETLKLIELLNTHKYILNNMIMRLEIAVAIEIKILCFNEVYANVLGKTI